MSPPTVVNVQLSDIFTVKLVNLLLISVSAIAVDMQPKTTKGVKKYRKTFIVANRWLCHVQFNVA